MLEGLEIDYLVCYSMGMAICFSPLTLHNPMMALSTSIMSAPSWKPSKEHGHTRTSVIREDLHPSTSRPSWVSVLESSKWFTEFPTTLDCTWVMTPSTPISMVR